MNGLSLCAGIGTLDLGVEIAFADYRCIAAVENNPHAARRFALRFPEARIFEDVLEFDGRPLHGLVDCVVAGWPCQPHSVAGKRRGTADERWIWDDVVRILRECGAPLFAGENVAGILRDTAGGSEGDDGGDGLDDDADGPMGGMGTVLRDLAGMGYVCAWGSLRASQVGASHGRKRTFFLAYHNEQGLQLLREALDYNRGEPSGHHVERRGPNVAYDAGGGFGIDGIASRVHRHSDECGKGLENPSHAGLASDGAKNASGAGKAAGVSDGPSDRLEFAANVADAELERRHSRGASEPGCEGGPALSEHAGGDVGDPERTRQDESRSGGWGPLFAQSGVGLDNGSERSGGMVADAGDGLLPVPRRRQDRRDGTRSASAFLAHSDTVAAERESEIIQPPAGGTPRERLQRERNGDAAGSDGIDLAHNLGAGLEERRGDWRVRERETVERSHAGVEPFAPGPADARWAHILQSRPDLAPALSPVTFALALALQKGEINFPAEIESGFRGLVDGVASWLVERRPRLQCCGNGVVPLQAAAVFTVLARRLLKT